MVHFKQILKSEVFLHEEKRIHKWNQTGSLKGKMRGQLTMKDIMVKYVINNKSQI